MFILVFYGTQHCSLAIFASYAVFIAGLVVCDNAKVEPRTILFHPMAVSHSFLILDRTLSDFIDIYSIFMISIRFRAVAILLEMTLIAPNSKIIRFSVFMFTRLHAYSFTILLVYKSEHFIWTYVLNVSFPSRFECAKYRIGFKLIKIHENI